MWMVVKRTKWNIYNFTKNNNNNREIIAHISFYFGCPSFIEILKSHWLIRTLDSWERKITSRRLTTLQIIIKIREETSLSLKIVTTITITKIREETSLSLKIVTTITITKIREETSLSLKIVTTITITKRKNKNWIHLLSYPKVFSHKNYQLRTTV